MKAARRHPRAAWHVAKDGIKARPAYFAGRSMTGALVSKIATPYVGFPLTGLAAYGSTVMLAQSGALEINFYRGLILGL
jgi:hypothetical protein